MSETKRAKALAPQEPQEPAGWRQDRPLEDPEKMKRWGIIAAKPSEFLVHVRGGQVLARTSGQGSSCFKWPWDAVAIIPTSINRLQFKADQVTREKVGVEVTGLAVYRIVEPLVTFRMLNFSYAERASQKLGEILKEMFVGATRRLVANLAVEEVLTRRKESLAAELMKEIAPVVQGDGRTQDSTDRGWGVVIDTIEVQDVRVLSETVFAEMQSEYRAALAQKSREAELASRKALALREAEDQRAIARARLTAEVTARTEQAEAETQAQEKELAEASRRAAMKAEAERAERERQRLRGLAEIEAEAELAAARAQNQERTRLAELARQAKLLQAERAVAEAQAEAERLAATQKQAMEKLALEASLARTELTEAAEILLEQKRLELQKIRDAVALARLSAERGLDNDISEQRIRLGLVQDALPALAEALGQKVEHVERMSLTQIGEGGFAASAAQLVGLLRALGFELGQRSDA